MFQSDINLPQITHLPAVRQGFHRLFNRYPTPVCRRAGETISLVRVFIRDNPYLLFVPAFRIIRVIKNPPPLAGGK